MHWRSRKNSLPDGLPSSRQVNLAAAAKRRPFSFDYREFAVLAFSVLVVGVPPIGITLGLIFWMLFFA